MFWFILRLLGFVSAVGATSVNLTSPTTSFQPPGAWTVVPNSVCSNEKPLYSTTMDGASVTFQYTRGFFVNGTGLSSGLIVLREDGAFTGSVDLGPSNVTFGCGELLGISAPDDLAKVHTGMLTLSGPGRFDLYDISYTGQPVPDGPQPHHKSNVATIVGAVVGSIAGAIFIGVTVCFLRARLRSPSKYGKPFT